MTHDTAVRTVVSLVPEMEKSGAAEVLNKYASNEDLAPAQLEKLAQVYNTLRTVSHIDNAEESARGDTVSLIDVPTLVVGYATGIGQEKLARTPDSFGESHDISRVDLNRALRREITPLEKVASTVTAPANEIIAKERLMTDVATVRAALLDLELDAEFEMSKLASELFDAAPRAEGEHFRRDISEFEEEALQYASAEVVKSAGDYMEAFAAPHRTKLDRFDYDREITKYAYDIDHAMGRKFAELAKTAAQLEVIQKLAANPPSPYNDEDTAAVMDDLSDEARARLEGDAGLGFEEPAPKVEEEEDPADKALRDAEEVSTKTTDAPAAGGSRPARDSDDDAKDSKGGGGGDGGSKGKSTKPERSISSILGGAIAAPVKATGGALRSGAAKADELLQGLVGKERQNTMQRNTDISIEDIKRAMNLRRMIGTDPVLKEADPKEVMEIYNAVARHNPEIAGDMASLKLILREAVNYEGLTLDSQKLLTDVRNNSEKGEKESEENARRRYSVGGAATPKIIS